MHFMKRPISYSFIALPCLIFKSTGAQPVPPSTVGHSNEPLPTPSGDQSNLLYQQINTTVHSHYKNSRIGQRQILTAEADVYCLNGFDLNKEKDICELLDERRADIGCPQGWDYKKGECSTTVVRPADRYCAEGFQDFHGRCKRILQAPKQLSCPPAYKRSEIGCVKDVETDAIVSCDTGELKHGVCVWQDIIKPLPSCSSEFELFGDMCAKRKLLKADKICPPGFILGQDDCEQIKSLPAIQLCPENSILVGEVCTRESIVNPQFQCHDGIITEHKQHCTAETITGPSERCPVGSESVGELCILEERVRPVESCPRGTKPSGSHGCIGGKGKQASPFSKSCPLGFQFFDKSTCIRRSTVDKELVCPTGFSLQGTACVATDYIPPRTLCPEGARMSRDGQCVILESFLTEKICPPEFIKDDDLCLNRIVAEPIPTCSVGSFDPIQDACVLAETIPSKIECPPFSKRILSGNNEILCQETLKKEPKISCPPEFVASDQSQSVCIGRAVAEGELRCLAPYSDKGQICEFEEILPKIMGCADGSFLKGTSCIAPETQPPVVMCPEGYLYEQDSQMCRKRMVTKPTAICPKGYIYDNLVRKCYTFVEGVQEATTTTSTSTSSPAQKLLPLQVQPVTSTSTSTTTKRG